MLGGIIGPIMEEAAVTATENSLSYPSFSMAGKSIPPIAAVSATAEPDIVAKNTEATMLICASDPRIRPTSSLARRIMSSTRPSLVISSPASINSGTASRAKLFTPW